MKLNNHIEISGKLEYRIILTISFTILFALLFLSFQYYVERLYGDSAYYLTQILNTKWFAVEHLRPVSYFSQFIVVIGVNIGLPANVLLLLFSFNEWLVLFVMFIVITFLLKNEKIGFAMLVCAIIGQNYNFFNPVSELIVGMPFFFLLWALLLRKETIITLILILLLIVFTIFNHPIYSLLLPVMIVLHYLYVRPKLNYYFILIYITLGLSIVFHYYAMDSYDRNQSEALKMSQFYGINFFTGTNWEKFLFFLLKLQLGFFIMFFMLLFGYFKQRKNTTFFIFLTGSILSYIFLVLYSFGSLYHISSIEPFERYLYPLSIIVTGIYFLINEKKIINVSQFVIIALILIYHLTALSIHADKIHKRYEHLKYALKSASFFNDGKVQIRKENYGPFGSNWILVNESMILTSAFYPNMQQVFIQDAFSEKLLKSVARDSAFFYNPWWIINISDFNPEYFNFRSGTILIANTDSIQSDKDDSFFRNISIAFMEQDPNLSDNDDLWIPVIISNTNNCPLTSGLKKEQCYISYHWRKNNGEKVMADEVRTPLLMDVYSTVYQEIRLKTPDVPGSYIIDLSLVYEGKKWINIDSYKVEIK